MQALAGRLPPGAVRLKERVTALERQGAGWRVATDGGTTVDADAVILATEAYQAARLLRHADPALGHLLEDIPYASSATVTLAYRREAIRHPLDGFGFVVPQVERRPVIAGTFSSVKYPGRAPEGHVLLRVFVGGALNEAAVAADDAALVATARGELATLLGAEGEPRLHAREPLREGDAAVPGGPSDARGGDRVRGAAAPGARAGGRGLSRGRDRRLHPLRRRGRRSACWARSPAA